LAERTYISSGKGKKKSLRPCSERVWPGKEKRMRERSPVDRIPQQGRSLKKAKKGKKERSSTIQWVKKRIHLLLLTKQRAGTSAGKKFFSFAKSDKGPRYFPPPRQVRTQQKVFATPKKERKGPKKGCRVRRKKIQIKEKSLQRKKLTEGKKKDLWKGKRNSSPKRKGDREESPKTRRGMVLQGKCSKEKEKKRTAFSQGERKK